MKGEKGMPRFIYENNPRPAGYPSTVECDAILHTQTFQCESCGHRIHFDTDWEDPDGGFVGSSVTVNQYHLANLEHQRNAR